MYTTSIWEELSDEMGDIDAYWASYKSTVLRRLRADFKNSNGVKKERKKEKRKRAFPKTSLKPFVIDAMGFYQKVVIGTSNYFLFNGSRASSWVMIDHEWQCLQPSTRFSVNFYRNMKLFSLEQGWGLGRVILSHLWFLFWLRGT